MAADLTAITYFAPIATFLIVFAVSYAIFAKTKLLDEKKGFNIFLSFLISAVFISAAGAISYVQTILPWIAVLLVSLVFIFAITGFIGKPAESLNKPLSIIVLIALGLIFLVSAFVVFSSGLLGYLPGPNFGLGLSQETFTIFDWLYSPRIAGAIFLIIISAIVTWVLVKSK